MGDPVVRPCTPCPERPPTLACDRCITCITSESCRVCHGTGKHPASGRRCFFCGGTGVEAER